MIANFSLKPMILVIPVLLALVFIELGFAYLKGRKSIAFRIRSLLSTSVCSASSSIPPAQCLAR